MREIRQNLNDKIEVMIESYKITYTRMKPLLWPKRHWSNKEKKINLASQLYTIPYLRAS